MKVKIEIELKPFSVPNFVIAEPKNPKAEPSTYHLSVLDEDTLDRLCNEFRREVFKKANKQQPLVSA